MISRAQPSEAYTPVVVPLLTTASGQLKPSITNLLTTVTSQPVLFRDDSSASAKTLPITQFPLPPLHNSGPTFDE